MGARIDKEGSGVRCVVREREVELRIEKREKGRGRGDFPAVNVGEEILLSLAEELVGELPSLRNYLPESLVIKNT